MNTQSIAKLDKSAAALRHEVAPDTLSEILRNAAGLSREELLELQGAIAGWLRLPDETAAAPAPTTEVAPNAPPSIGWIESKPATEGRYYYRRWWGKQKNGKRKKYSVYLGKNPSGPAPKKKTTPPKSRPQSVKN